MFRRLVSRIVRFISPIPAMKYDFPSPMSYWLRKENIEKFWERYRESKAIIARHEAEKSKDGVSS